VKVEYLKKESFQYSTLNGGSAFLRHLNVSSSY